MKKKIMIFSLILVLISLFVPVFANATETLGIIASKNSYVLDQTTGEYRIELKVPGQDGSNKHDEVILMIDGSYSMDNEWPLMKETIIQIGKTVLNGNGNTQLTLMAFGMGDNEVITHVKDANQLATYLGELPGTLLYGRSSTNCEAGFTGVMNYIENHDSSLNEVHVVFISDGNINTDETPYNFYNWKQNSWLRWSVKTIIDENLASEINHIKNGGAASLAFKSVFANYDDIQAILANATEDQKMVWADLVWKMVYEQANLDFQTAYPVSVVERAFVSYDKTNGTYVQDLFYYPLVGRSYPNRWVRTPQAALKLTKLDKVTSLYMVDYDSYSSWMDTAITSDKAVFVKSNGIAGLIDALKSVLTQLAATPYNDVVVTDYMSKWVKLDKNSIKIIDDTTNTVIYSIKDGWLIDEEKRPTKKDSPITIELVSENNYLDGGSDVVGNTHDEIYKLTWYIKDGSLLRSENYHLEYNITMDTEEKYFEYNKNYKTNGSTTITYIDETNNKVTEAIKVPVGYAKNPQNGQFTFKSGSASHIAFLYVGPDGNVHYSHKIDFTNNDNQISLPYKEGYTLVVFIKQSTSGMIWTSNQLDNKTIAKVVSVLKTNNKAYKGHAVLVYGNGKHILEYKKGKKTNSWIYYFK